MQTHGWWEEAVSQRYTARGEAHTLQTTLMMFAGQLAMAMGVGGPVWWWMML